MLMNDNGLNYDFLFYTFLLLIGMLLVPSQWSYIVGLLLGFVGGLSVEIEDED